MGFGSIGFRLEEGISSYAVLQDVVAGVGITNDDSPINVLMGENGEVFWADSIVNGAYKMDRAGTITVLTLINVRVISNSHETIDQSIDGTYGLYYDTGTNDRIRITKNVAALQSIELNHGLAGGWSGNVRFAISRSGRYIGLVGLDFDTGRTRIAIYEGSG